MAALGAALLLGAGGVAAAAGSNLMGLVGVALLLLGAGWNAALIGGSTLLTEANVDPALRTRAEGLGELGMGAAAAVVAAEPGWSSPPGAWGSSGWWRPRRV